MLQWVSRRVTHIATLYKRHTLHAFYTTLQHTTTHWFVTHSTRDTHCYKRHTCRVTHIATLYKRHTLHAFYKRRVCRHTAATHCNTTHTFYLAIRHTHSTVCQYDTRHIAIRHTHSTLQCVCRIAMCVSYDTHECVCRIRVCRTTHTNVCVVCVVCRIDTHILQCVNTTHALQVSLAS